jgi:alkylation response protein AidB-like acyl-CoA dehydrogenase
LPRYGKGRRFRRFQGHGNYWLSADYTEDPINHHLCRRTSILARNESQVLLQNAQRFAALIFDAAANTDREGIIGSPLWAEFRHSGLAMSPFPETFAGGGLCDPGRHNELCTILRILGSADLSVARLFEGHVNAVSLVERYGEAAQLQELSERVLDGGLSAVWAADDAKGLQVVGDSHRTLHGRKILASGAGFVTDPIVTAKADDGQVMCLLHLEMDEKFDLSGWNALGMRSTATGSIELSGISLARGNMIGLAGDFTRQPYFSGGAWRFCAAHVGATERLVDLFRDHLVARSRGQDPYQRQRLAQCMVSAKTARHWVEEATRRLSAEDADTGNVVAFANLTRMVTERCALDVMEAVQRGVGLTSFIRPHPIERISRDLATYLRQPVPDLAMSDGAKAFLSSKRPIGEF